MYLVREGGFDAAWLESLPANRVHRLGAVLEHYLRKMSAARSGAAGARHADDV